MGLGGEPPEYKRCRKILFLWLLLMLLKPSEAIEQENKPEEVVQESNSTTNAYSMFSIVLAGGTAGGYGELGSKHIVLKNGIVYDEWKGTNVNEGNVTDGSIFRHDQYTDRISFDFFYGSFHPYDISTPSVKSSNQGVAKPKVVEFQTDDEEHSGSFTIVYDCQKNAQEQLRNVTLNVILPVVSDLSARFSFQKVCGSGAHKFLEFGFYEESANDNAEVSRRSFMGLKEQLVVGPHVVSTKLYLHLHAPARSQEFFHLTTQTSSNNLEVVPKGPVFGGVLTQSESGIIHILYECHGKGSFDVSIEIPVYPFKPLKATWTKDCGGGMPRGLSVGTGVWTAKDVVKNGQTSEKWMLAIHGTSSSVSRQAPIVNDSIRFQDYWVQNDGFPMHIARAVVTIENPSLLTVFPSAYTRGTLYQFETDGLLQADEKVRLRLRLVCKKKGRSLVVVTLPIKSFSNIEFGFLKECRAPQRYTRSGFLRTANSVMVTVAVFMMAAFLYWWTLNWKRREIPLIDEKPTTAYQNL